MPYVAKSQRQELDAGRLPLDAGELNYAITKLVDGYLSRIGVRYGSLNEAIGVLECAKLELYRRLAAPYEDKKLAVNGEVYGAPR